MFIKMNELTASKFGALICLPVKRECFELYAVVLFEDDGKTIKSVHSFWSEEECLRKANLYLYYGRFSLQAV